MIKRKVEYYFHNNRTSIKKIRSNDCEWENQPIIKFIFKTDRPIVSQTCRYLLKQLLECTKLRAFYYLFAYSTPNRPIEKLMRHFQVRSLQINLRATSGILQYDDTHGQYVLFGRVLVTTQLVNVDRILNCLIDGYSIARDSDVDLLQKSLTWLENNSSIVPHGTKYNIFVRGHLYIATRDESMSYSYQQTENR
jgi:hypothetical protein